MKPQDKLYSKFGPKLIKAFPQFSDKKFYMVIKDQLHRFDIDELHAYKRQRMIHASPCEKLYHNRYDKILDYGQCDERHVAILFESNELLVID